MTQKSLSPQEAEKAWDVEARALNAINQLDHSHIMKSIAAIRRGASRYFMFPWAEDNLREYWKSKPTQSPDPELICEAVGQLRGLADALDRLHNWQGGRPISSETYQTVKINVDPADDTAEQTIDEDDLAAYRNPMSQESIRHGDLKPDNILRFPDCDRRIGTLKLGDMGLAKRHVAATEKRPDTSTRYGTRRYEGPEAMSARQGRSRLYDLWSMGCITFEFIIWLLYGMDALEEFWDQAAKSSPPPSEFQYYKLQDTGAGLRPVVNPIVIHWMDHIQKEDPECQSESSSMLKDLLHIVREQLLVVDLSPTRGSTLADGGGGRNLAPGFVGGKRRYRATASEFRRALDAIKKREKDAGYVHTGRDRSDVSLPALPSTYRSFLDPLAKYSPGDSRRADNKMGSLSTGVMQRPISADYSLPPLERWEFAVDNDFAATAIKHLKSAGAPKFIRNELCARCARLNFWSSGFAIEDEVDALAKSAASCDLCRLLHDASHGSNSSHSEKIRFERTQSVITVTGNNFPVLSLIRSPGKLNSH
jgi:serine/threonine protein kinase